MPLLPSALPPKGEASRYGANNFLNLIALPSRERQRGGGFAASKESQPRLAALGSPFQGKGLAWTLPPSSGRRCPEGAEVGWGKRYFRHTAFPSRERQRGGGFAAKKKANPASLRSAAPSKGEGLAWTLPVSSFRAKARNLFSLSVKQKMWGYR